MPKHKYPKTGGGPQEKLKDTTEMVMNIYGKGHFHFSFGCL